MGMNYFVSRREIMTLNVGGDAWPGGKCNEADCRLPMLTVVEEYRVRVAQVHAYLIEY
jgi:hypothetical protein